MGPPTEPPQQAPAHQASERKLHFEGAVLAFVIVAGFGGGVALAVLSTAPPAVIAVLLATGISALVHRFLGGLTGAEFLFGALKLAGTIGTLMIVFYVLNHYLEAQRTRAYESGLEGPWRWRVHSSGWVANLSFVKAQQAEEYGVTGVVREGESSTAKVLYEITNGQARRDAFGGLVLNLQVKDYVLNREVVWVTTKPLTPSLAFGGSFNVQDKQKQGPVKPDPWGIFLVRPD